MIYIAILISSIFLVTLQMFWDANAILDSRMVLLSAALHVAARIVENYVMKLFEI